MKSLKNTPVLVTGATGFVGSRLSELLATREEAQVTGIGRNLDRVSYLKNMGVVLQAADILDEEALKKWVKGKDIVIHTAAALVADLAMAQKVNVDATETLIRLAAEAGVSRFVHVSTVGACDMTNLTLVEESAPLALNHSSVYPKTKAEAEKRAIETAAAYGMELSIVRPTMIYGPGHGVWSEGMFSAILKGNPVLFGDGSGNFHPVYIDDVVEGLILCAIHPKAAGETFNLSNGLTTWQEFMSNYSNLSGKKLKSIPLLVARLLAFANKIPGIKTPIDQGFIEMATSKKDFPNNKAAKLIGWRPQVSYEEGMKKTLEWLKKELL
ncbi:NAD-dependent epimerase/dehydratase family protein [Algoriphagus hitonicola]|uniref:Nucleoside-diphosphate-sugar epimerase n=1 Tax=Algoriphagus hitonicola TaxID=435880 RepID=A0A1I2Q647_9BACT|nr:NAD(P)-dependent oxidoreductase [Algoriphagus hitonicola]SFG21091.1 Nucleoside-diphosphate-sugar epimerase [Algoriphagus hitonicola]